MRASGSVQPTNIVHSKTMAICCDGCTPRSGCDKVVSFFRIPKIVMDKGSITEKLSKKRHSGFISAINAHGIFVRKTSFSIR